ncbi:MAG: S8 family peptidase [bacterium]|nr:S8 family peptidase [bacterium]
MNIRRIPVPARLLLPVGVLAAIGGLLALDHQGERRDTDRGAPALLGFMGAADAPQAYAPGRLLVKVRDVALLPELAADGQAKGRSAALTLTGLASLDALVGKAGLAGIKRPYDVDPGAKRATAAGVDRWLRFDFDGTPDLPALAEALAALPEVEAVSLDWRAWPAEAATDPLLADNWGHENTVQLPAFNWVVTHAHTGPGVGTKGFDADLPQAWQLPKGFGSDDVIIAIIDSGVDLDHPDLRLVEGYDFGDGDTNPDDDSAEAGHGTHCAGIAAALANGSGAVGVAPGCAVMPLKVADSDGIMWFSAVQAALYHAADKGVAVASLSFGAPLKTDAATEAALRYAYEAGVVLVAATGNANRSEISYPACSPYVIAVGAASPGGDRKRSSSAAGDVGSGTSTDPNGVTCDGERWWGSSYGTPVQDAADAVDLLGPTILPTCDIAGAGGSQSGDVEPFFSGTSCATPYVAGVVALVCSTKSGLSPAQVREALVVGARDITSVESGPGWDRYAGYGLVNAVGAILGEAPVLPDDGPGSPDLEPEAAPAAVPAAVAVLEQNQPNPFNPVTRIAFTLPQGGPARLAVYSLRGERVAVLADGELAAGPHEVTWDATGHPSGIYVYRLQAGATDLTRKMTLVK